MITLDKLREFGADVDEGLTRCFGNEALYLKLVGKVEDEPNFTRLKDAIDAGDKDKAFEAAHAVKGALGNLSLTPMSDLASEITEHLRAKEDADYDTLLNQLFELKDTLAGLCH